MKICIDCGRQLFDRDKSCDKCNSKNIISEEEYNKMVTDTEIFSGLIREGYFAKKVLTDAVFQLLYD